MIPTCFINCHQRMWYSQVAGPYCGKPVQWPVSSSTERAADILKSWVALMRNRWSVLNWKLRFVILSPYFRESNILVSLMEEHGIGGGLGGKRNIQDPNLNPRWLLHVILTPFLFLVCLLQCGEIQGETGQTRKVPWRRRGLVKNDLEKRKSPSMVVLHMVPGFGSSVYPTLRYSNGSYFIGNFVHGMREGPGSLQVLLILMMIGFLYWYWLHQKINYPIRPR